MIGWLPAGWLAGWLHGWLHGWLDGWLHGRLPGWLAELKLAEMKRMRDANM